MSGNRVQRLAGMSDLAGAEYGRLRAAASAFDGFASGLGYELLDTPLLEQTELFVRKSGGELTTQLYTFIDPGGNRVSLRPEFTSSVIRCFAERGGAAEAPARWQYRGPVFRHDGGYRQFTQVGAELIGPGGVDADLEVLSLASNALHAMGVEGHTLRIGHLGVLHDLLSDFELSEPARLFVVGGIHDLSAGQASPAGLAAKAQSLGLARSGPEANTLASLGSEAAREVIDGMMGGPAAVPMGQRTTDEVVERLLRKARTADRADVLEDALNLVNEVASIEGPPADALARARSAGVRCDSLGELEDLVTRLDDGGVGDATVVVDFGVVRGLSYYTGFIFDVETRGPAGPVSLGGGGRYDGLVKALGGEDTPALGFAYTLESVVAAAAG